MKSRLMEVHDEAFPFSKCNPTLIDGFFSRSLIRSLLSHLKMQPTETTSIKGSSAGQAEKEEVDSRSIYVGNVDYASTPVEIKQHFQPCGTVNRVTLLADKFGQPKGFAYVEFVNIDAVQNALLLNESELHGRKLKVSAKRTNILGMKQYCGRRPFCFRSRRSFMPFPSYPPYGHRRFPRFRRPMRYRPY